MREHLIRNKKLLLITFFLLIGGIFLITPANAWFRNPWSPVPPSECTEGAWRPFPDRYRCENQSCPSDSNYALGRPYKCVNGKWQLQNPECAWNNPVDKISACPVGQGTPCAPELSDAKIYSCTDQQLSGGTRCASDAGIGVPYRCKSSGTWDLEWGSAGECATKCDVYCDTSYPSDRFHACVFDGKDNIGNDQYYLGKLDEERIDHFWYGGQVAFGKSDDVSIVWRKAIYFDEGNYEFNVQTDEGARLYIDDQGLIGIWTPTERWIKAGHDDEIKYLPAGFHRLKLEWFDNTETALITLDWKKLEPVIKVDSLRCETIVKNGDPKAKIDLVFLGDKFLDESSRSRYLEAVENFRNNLFVVPPYNDFINNFNLYRVDGFYDYQCRLESIGMGEAYNCWKVDTLTPARIEEASGKCPGNDIKVIIVNDTFSAAGPVASHEYKAMSIRRGSLVDNKWVVAHEMAHILASLGDEFSYNRNSGLEKPEGIPNCDNQSSCSKWQWSGAGCYKGCGYTNWYRPTACSIMGNPVLGENFCGTFGTVSDGALRNSLRSGSSTPGGNQGEFFDISVKYADNAVKVTGIDVSSGASKAATENGYTAETITAYDQVLSSTKFEFPQFFVDNFEQGTGGLTQLDQTSTSVSLPADITAAKIKIYDPWGNLIQIYNISTGTNEKTGTGIAKLTGNMTGRIWLDANGDGIYDAGEKLIQNGISCGTSQSQTLSGVSVSYSNSETGATGTIYPSKCNPDPYFDTGQISALGTYTFTLNVPSGYQGVTPSPTTYPEYSSCQTSGNTYSCTFTIDYGKTIDRWFALKRSDFSCSLQANPTEGTSPLTTSLIASLYTGQTPIAPTLYQWDFEGDGVWDVVGTNVYEGTPPKGLAQTRTYSQAKTYSPKVYYEGTSSSQLYQTSCSTTVKVNL